MTAKTAWIIVAVLVVGAIVISLASYWMVGVGLLVIAIAIGWSVAKQEAGPPRPSE